MEIYRDALDLVQEATAEVVSNALTYTRLFQAGALTAANEALQDMMRSCGSLSDANDAMARLVVDDVRRRPRRAVW